MPIVDREKALTHKSAGNGFLKQKNLKKLLLNLVKQLNMMILIMYFLVIEVHVKHQLVNLMKL